MSSLLRNFLRVVTACPQQQQLADAAARRALDPLPRGAIVENLGELNYQSLQQLLPAPVLSACISPALLPGPPALPGGQSLSSDKHTPSSPSSTTAATTERPWFCEEGRTMDSTLERDSLISMQEGRRMPCAKMAAALGTAASAAASSASLDLPIAATPATSPIAHTALYQETVRRCALTESMHASSSSAASRSLAATNVLTLLRQREQPNRCNPRSHGGSCNPRLAPSSSALSTNLSMRRVPSTLRTAHHYESRVFCSQFSHSGDVLAVATQDQHVRLYEVNATRHSSSHTDPDDSDIRSLLDSSPPPDSAAASASSSAAACSLDQTGMRIFDSREPESLDDRTDSFGTPLALLPLPSHSPSSPFFPAGWPCIKDVRARQVGWAVVDMDFSGDDRWMVYSTWSKNLQLVSTDPLSALHVPLDLQPTSTRFCIYSVKFSPCGKLLLGGSSDRHMYLYDLTRGSRIAAIPAHCADINTVAWLGCSEAPVVATGSDDCVVKLWDLRCLAACKPTPIGCFVGHTQGITSLASKGDGRHLLTNSKDQSAKVWDMRRTCQPKDALGATKTPNGEWDYRWARFQPRTTMTQQCVSEKQIAEDLARAQAARQQAAAAASSAASSSPVPSSPSSRCAANARAAACSLLSAIMPSSAAAVIAGVCPSAAPAQASSNGSTYADKAAVSTNSVQSSCFKTSSSAPASAAASSLLCPSKPCADLSLMTYTGHRVLETLVRAYFSPLETTGQRYIYSGSQTGVIHIWDLLTGETVQRLSGHYGTVREVAWHPKEPMIVSSSWDHSLGRWECPTG
jgi:WD40 repeat protein